MKSTYIRVLEILKTAGVSLVSASEAAVIEKRFRAASLDIGSDFVRFYAAVGGMTDSATDANLWSCWDVERILQEAQTYQGDGVAFADWCIASYFHIVRRESAARSSVWVDWLSKEHRPQKVADSLVEFFERYLAKDAAIYVGF